MIVIERSDWRTMPWANGGGITHEVLVEPVGSALTDVDWRISVAEVHETGPFSSLPGIDRLLLLLSGGGMSLHIDGEMREVSTQSALSFRGEAEVACVHLDGGPTLDLNVMTRRDRWSSQLEVFPAGATAHCAALEQVVVFALDSMNAVLLEAGESCDLASQSAVIRLHRLHVRPALTPELTAAGEVAATAYAHSNAANPETQSYSNVVRTTVQNPNPGPVLIAIRGGDVVGTVTVCPPGTAYSELAQTGELEFRFLAVAPAHQGTGVAQALLESVLAHGRAVGSECAVCFVIQWNEPAHRLYRERGFVRVPERDWSPLPGVLLQAYRLPLG